MRHIKQAIFDVFAKKDYIKQSITCYEVEMATAIITEHNSIDTRSQIMADSVYGEAVAFHEPDTASNPTAALTNSDNSKVLKIQAMADPIYYRLSSSAPSAGNRQYLPAGASDDIAMYKIDSSGQYVRYFTHVTIAAA